MLREAVTERAKSHTTRQGRRSEGWNKKEDKRQQPNNGLIDDRNTR